MTKTPKYDEAKVEALIEAAKNWNHKLPREIMGLVQALKPEPEMEYVLPEELPGLDRRGGVCAIFEQLYLRGQAGVPFDGKDVWRELREATRIPARPKPRSGSEFSTDELGELTNLYWNCNWNSGGNDNHDDIRAVIDKINEMQAGAKPK